MKARFFGKLTCLLVSSFLVGCSGTYHSYKESLSYAFNPEPDVELTLAQVTASAADLVYFRQGEHRQITLALAFIEQGQHKWVSTDNVVITMQQGRVVRTQGFANDLLYVESEIADPLAQGINIVNGANWQSKVDWAVDEYGYPVSSTFARPQPDTLSLFGQQFDVLKVVETLNYDAPSQYLRFNQQWQNIYWFETSSGQLLKTQQKFSPLQIPMEFTFVSRAVRLISKGERNATN